MNHTYRTGQRVTHLRTPATITSGNEPDGIWTLTVGATVVIEYDKAPRGHSRIKEVRATEVNPLGPEN
jgi:hypothetical protein